MQLKKVYPNSKQVIFYLTWFGCFFLESTCNCLHTYVDLFQQTISLLLNMRPSQFALHEIVRKKIYKSTDSSVQFSLAPLKTGGEVWNIMLFLLIFLVISISYIWKLHKSLLASVFFYTSTWSMPEPRGMLFSLKAARGREEGGN